MTAIVVNMSPVLKQAIRLEAAKEAKSMAELMREVLENYLLNKEEETQ